MQRGSIVICVDNDRVENRLTKEKLYLVLQVSGEYLGIQDDNGVVYNFISTRFIPIKKEGQ